MSARHTDIDFENTIEENIEMNIFTYDYIYNGAGVAVGDVNNDGLIDIYFSGNSVPNKLYINKGDFVFDDITEEAQVAGISGWKTGATMVDINNDGWLDIYVCYSGLKDAVKANQLFINNGNKDGKVSFTEKAKDYGLEAKETFSTQAYFFDFDQDQDLDMFLLNHGIDYHSSFANASRNRNSRHPQFGNRLYRNDTGYFKDVSDSVGIDGGWLNYGLSVSIADFNNDNFPDIYASNDFDERDFFYLNTGNGKFKEVLTQSFAHISKFTMGTDAADINNDGWVDLVTLDMLPEDNYRQKLLKGPDAFDKYNFFLSRGFHRQQMRNMLQLNQGLNSAGLPVFSEIGQLAGVSNTDWSWAPLFADFDNDGNKDLFVTNGYLRDFTNLDFQKYDFENARKELFYSGKNLQTEEGKKFMFDFIQKMSTIKVHNYIFKNSGNLTFENTSADWGFAEETLSNGAVYADLDNDGDLDLVVNNINEKAGIYCNHTDKLNENHYLKIKLIGDDKNIIAIGAKVSIRIGNESQYTEQYLTRGYLSSVDRILHFGLGKSATVNQVKVEWPNGNLSVIDNVQADQLLEISYRESKEPSPQRIEPETHTIFKNLGDSLVIKFSHKENKYVDFKLERLLLNQLSMQGPKLAVGDVNGDKLDDVFIGGASGQYSKLFLQNEAGVFRESISHPWYDDNLAEDVDALFFDADGDHDQDLYVVSGGNELDPNANEYHDRIYINKGNGIFEKGVRVEFNRAGGGSCVQGTDFDKDGDTDLFVGGWTYPHSYPKSSESILLRNDSKKDKAIFTDVTNVSAPELTEIGLVRDAVWSDFDNDGLLDLIITSDWNPVTVFKNEGTKFTNVTDLVGLNTSNGFWSVIKPIDIEGDGDLDYIVGNLGLNSELNASKTEPLRMYVSDFDNDGKLDPVVCSYIQGVSYPLATRDELQSQILPLRKKFVRYEPFAKATINEILDSVQLKKCTVKEVYELRSCIIEQVSKNKFELKPMPVEVQFAPVQTIEKLDYNGDGIDDLMIGGNFYGYRTEYGPFDASIGLLLKGKGGSFEPVNQKESGILIQGDVRDFAIIKTSSKKNLILISKNNGYVQVLQSEF